MNTNTSSDDTARDLRSMNLFDRKMIMIGIFSDFQVHSVLYTVRVSTGQFEIRIQISVFNVVETF